MTETKLVERHLASIRARNFPFGLSWLEAGIMVGVWLIMCGWALGNTSASTLLAVAAASVVNAVVFLAPVPGTPDERLFQVFPRFLAFCGRVTAGKVDIHFRTLEGMHYTDRTVPTDVPMSIHLGSRLWLSKFDYNGRDIGLIIQGGSIWQPWKAASMIAVRLSGQDQMLLESFDVQEKLIGRWNGGLNDSCRANLGLSGLQELLMSRPRLQGEGAHWPFDELLKAQTPELAAQYRQVQLVADSLDVDRRFYMVLRTGGTFTSWLSARRTGSSRAGVETHWRKVLGKLPGVLRNANVSLIRILDFARVDDMLRLWTDPGHAPAVGYRETDQSPRASATHIAPIAEWDESRDKLIVNGWHTCTFRVIGWPATTQGPQFLGTALINHHGIIRVSLSSRPEDRKKSLYVAKAGMTNSESRRDRRRARGTVETEEDRMKDAEPFGRDVQIARGHHPLQYSCYLTVLAENGDELQAAKDELATECNAWGVDIQVCHSFQPDAYRFTLPFCGGI